VNALLRDVPRLPIALPVLVLLLSACTSIGAGSEHWARMDYSKLLLLTSLAQTGVVPQAPVITVPVS
jgi:hypothetical protein